MSTDFSSVLNNIIDTTEKFALSQTKPDDLTSQRLKNDAKSILKINPSLAAMVLGLIASVEGDVDECIKQHKLSIKLGKDPILNLNYAVSMKTLGRNAESFRLINNAMNLLPDPFIAINVYLLMAIYAGEYEKIQSCEDMLKNRGITSIPPDLQQYFDDVNTILMKAPFPYDIYPAIAAIQETISLSNNTRINNYALEEVDDELYYWSLVKADTKTITLMNCLLEEALSELEHINLDEFHIAFKAIENSTRVNPL
ncbi:MAG: hypothetical protein D0531_07535 [Methylococcales bacterium]|nr:MAG: hypothetical protein D0531_07535 [Methylococcales bacterium]